MWLMDAYSGTLAAMLAGVLYEVSDEAVAAGKSGASGLELESDAAMLAVGRAKAHVSTTCVPGVLMILMRWPRRTRVAAPRRAGIT